jgi:hypothetical protein
VLSVAESHVCRWPARLWLGFVIPGRQGRLHVCKGNPVLQRPAPEATSVSHHDGDLVMAESKLTFSAHGTATQQER